jgi:hypothetical protein
MYSILTRTGTKQVQQWSLRVTNLLFKLIEKSGIIVHIYYLNQDVKSVAVDGPHLFIGTTGGYQVAGKISHFNLEV